jgi:hypothetical protein
MKTDFVTSFVVPWKKGLTASRLDELTAILAMK